MLVLTFKKGGTYTIHLESGDVIEVEVLSIRGDKVQLGIEAPRSIPIRRHQHTRGTPECSKYYATECPHCGVCTCEDDWYDMEGDCPLHGLQSKHWLNLERA